MALNILVLIIGNGFLIICRECELYIRNSKNGRGGDIQPGHMLGHWLHLSK